MDDITSRALLADPETRRALQLDTLSAILPMGRRDRLAALLTDDDVETLKHLAREGIGENSLRALASDLAYLEVWAGRGGAAAGRAAQRGAGAAVPLDPRDPRSPTLPCLAIQLGRTKTGDADDEGRVLLVGPPVEALREWLERADITNGPVSRAAGRRSRRGR